MKPPFIVDAHHKVIESWAKYRKTLSHAPRLLTLDHHTDTSPAFRNHIKKHQPDDDFHTAQSSHLKEIDFKSEASIQKAIEKLNNDEHIIAALKTDILSSAFVVAHNAANTGVDIYREHKIACRNIERHDEALESSFLKDCILNFNHILKENKETLLLEENYILDIDLDYFNTFRSIDPGDDQLFKTLLQNAGLITIATEPDYVKGCALDKGLTSEFLLESLLQKYF